MGAAYLGALDRNSINVSCLLTQSDIINKYAYVYLRMLAAMLSRLKSIEHFIVRIFLPFKKGMKEDI